MTHPQVLGQKFTPIRRFSAWKTQPFWPHILNMTQYGSVPRVPERRKSEEGAHPRSLRFLMSRASDIVHIDQTFQIDLDCWA